MPTPRLHLLGRCPRPNKRLTWQCAQTTWIFRCSRGNLLPPVLRLPARQKVKGTLVAGTAWRVRILTLGWLYRQVTVDPKKHEVTIYRRYLWVFARRRRIRFEKIEAATYAYQDWSPVAPFSFTHDSMDVFSVGLRLYGGGERHLFYFFGDGTFTNTGPWPDWMLLGRPRLRCERHPGKRVEGVCRAGMQDDWRNGGAGTELKTLRCQ
jgi:hypothetical protein